MAVHDTIGDFLTIIRNASSARKESCTTQHSKMRAAIAAILKDEGYINDFSEGQDEKGFKTLTLALKFAGKTPAITGIERHSTPWSAVSTTVAKTSPAFLAVWVWQSSLLPKA
jgi:small subunit ribosomal protein S8